MSSSGNGRSAYEEDESAISEATQLMARQAPPRSPAWRGARRAPRRQSKMMRRVRIGLLVTIIVAGLVVHSTMDASSLATSWLTWVKANRHVGILAFVGFFLVACLLMLPQTPLMLGAGFALGVGWGQLAVSIGATLGAQLSFILGGNLLRAFVEEDIKPHFPSFDELDEILSQPELSFEVCLLVRMCPILPTNVLNYAIGATSIGGWPHFLATLIGMFPEEVMVVYIGSTLHDVSAVVRGDFTSGDPRGFFAGIAAVVIFTIFGTIFARRRLSVIAEQWRTRRVNTQHDAPAEDATLKGDAIHASGTETNNTNGNDHAI